VHIKTLHILVTFERVPPHRQILYLFSECIMVLYDANIYQNISLNGPQLKVYFHSDMYSPSCCSKPLWLLLKHF